MKISFLRANWHFIGLALLIASIPACSNRGSNRVVGVSVSGDIPTSMMKEFDKDGDGSISKAEFPKGFTFSIFDEDANGSIADVELNKVIQDWQEMKVGMSAFNLRILMKGKPVVGASVTLEPYAFMGTEVVAASGVSDNDGLVEFSIPEGSLPVADMKLMHPGLYRMKVSKQVNGKETLPAKFNSETILGCSVLPNGRVDESIDLN